MPSIIAVLDDLLFTVKIGDAAKRAGLTATFVRTREALLERLKQSASVVVVDLNFAAVDPVALGAQVKEQFPSTPIIGFVPHVQIDLRQQAEQSGYDVVLARSVFSERLSELLLSYSSNIPDSSIP